MIMTENPGIRMSARGVVLALSLGLLASVSTPAWSCDPPQGEHAKTCDSKSAGTLSTTEAGPLAFLLAQDRTPGPGPSDDRMRDLHARMEELRRQMEALEAQMREMHGGPGQPPMPARPAMPPRAPRPAETPRPIGRAQGFDVFAGEGCDQRFSLSDEKADAMYELLAPSDVTVVVSRTDDGVSISGKGKQCEILDRFVELYTRGQREGYSTYGETVAQWENRWDSEESYPMSPERAELVYQVLAFEDVPVLVNRNGNAISVKATRPDQRVVADLIAMLGAGGGQRRGAFGSGNSWRAGDEEDHADHADDAEAPEIWQAEREGDWDRREVEREIRDAQREAEREAREAQREAEIAVREAQREAEEAVREAEREAREAQREAEEAVREAMREAEALSRDGYHEEARQSLLNAERRAPRAPRGEHVDGERRYDMPRERAELLFNLLAPSDVEVVVSWDNDRLVVRGSEEDLGIIDGVVDIITRNLDKQERAELGRLRVSPFAVSQPGAFTVEGTPLMPLPALSALGYVETVAPVVEDVAGVEIAPVAETPTNAGTR